MRSFITRLATVGIIAMAVSGCSGSSSSLSPSGNVPGTNGQSQGVVNNAGNGGNALLRLVHGSPDLGPVDICLDNQQVAFAAPYKTIVQFSTFVGTHALIINQAGGGCRPVAFKPAVPASAGPPATAAVPAVAATIIGSVAAAANTRYSVVVAGSFKNGVGSTLAVVPFTDPALPSAGQAQVVFHNASPAAGASIALGAFPITPQGGSLPGQFTPAVAYKALATYPALPGFASDIAQQIGFSGATTVGGVPTATLYPGSIPAAPGPNANVATKPSYTGNVLPAGNDQVLQIYAVDAPAGGTTPFILLGAYDVPFPTAAF